MGMLLIVYTSHDCAGLGYVTEGVAVGVPVSSSQLQGKASGGIARLLQVLPIVF